MTTKSIIVIGDVAIDNNIYVGKRKSPETEEYGSQIISHKGGSYLLYEIISDLLSGKELTDSEREKWESFSVQFGLKDAVFSDVFPSSMTTYATWTVEEYEVAKQKIKAWKASELIGWGQEDKSKQGSVEKFSYTNYKLDDAQFADILVFDDGGNKIRNEKEAWLDFLKEKSINKISQVILKTAYPLGHGKLFNTLSTGYRNQLTIITSIDEIRKEDVLISKGISWEQTALDLVSELKNNKAISQLLKCRRLIVSLNTEGALYLEMDKNGEILKCRLVFDPEFMEGEWEKSVLLKGDVFGLMSCFTAAITYGFIESMRTMDINLLRTGKKELKINMESTVSGALSVMRRYKIIGHGSNTENPEFPKDAICSEIKTPKTQLASAFVPIPVNNENISKYLAQNWTILEGNYKSDESETPLPLFDTAFRFALLGNGELANTPFLKVNFFQTFDRREIESLRNIKKLIDDYLKEKNPEKPLSLGVFGMPGSGKSFAVKQLAKSLKLNFLEFNLSQFSNEKELEGAYHQVRDEVLKGSTPIVFWDEFDSRAYYWLQFLLAPMQDGKFQQGQITHPIGKSIFIFAGGTSYTFGTFGIDEPTVPDTKDEFLVLDYEKNLSKYNDFLLKKGPDFKSRLSGYLNVQGPNQLEKLNKDGSIMKDATWDVIYNEKDTLYPVRRALFIRSLCGFNDDKSKDKKMDIDYGLLNALIKTQKYAHGSRSLEKVLGYLKLQGNSKLQRSSLPSVSILNMMVNEDFIDLMDKKNDFDFDAFGIAPEIHKNWMNIGDKEGWKLEYHKDYKYLPSLMKDDNIAAARRIQKVLNALKPEVSLLIVKKEEADFYEPFNFNEFCNVQSHLEKMAIEEHKGWQETKENAGWQFDVRRNDDQKLHNCIIGWDENKGEDEKGNPVILSDDDKKKDMDAIKHYQEVLDKAGFVIVKEKS